MLLLSSYQFSALLVVFLISHGRLAGGSNPSEVINERLSEFEGKCKVIRQGSYWSYEWCHKQGVSQIHEDKDGNRTQGWSLGQYVAAGYLDRKYIHFFEGGKWCDSIRQGRKTMVIFHCCNRQDPSQTFSLQPRSVVERRTCEYEVNVCTNAACVDEGTIVDRSLAAGELKIEMKRRVKDMFLHGFKNYMQYAYPLDELRPLSCDGENFMRANNNLLLSLVESLDTLAIMGLYEELKSGVETVIQQLRFHVDENVSVFETNIRLLGGLLSAHVLCTEKVDCEGYQGQLLDMAVDLGYRLLPAFDTPTGIPFGTVNLSKGVPNGETVIASTAGAGSLVLEFGTLSLLSGKPEFAMAARKATLALSKLRSKIGLYGTHVNTTSGEWTERSSTIGSSVDSFFEYLLKGYVLFGDPQMYDAFVGAYEAIIKYLKSNEFYMYVQMDTGQGVRMMFDALQGFWPGMQTMYGDIDLAVSSLNAFMSVWRRHGAVPEEFDFGSWEVIRSSEKYPLRPEVVESIFQVYKATMDDTWLWAGVDIYEGIEGNCWTKCGYAMLANVETGEKLNSMPSFFLSETCKYLYLLFEDANDVYDPRHFVFNTEAHLLPIRPRDHWRSIFAEASSNVPTESCPWWDQWSQNSYTGAVPYDPISEPLHIGPPIHLGDLGTFRANTFPDGFHVEAPNEEVVLVAGLQGKRVTVVDTQGLRTRLLSLENVDDSKGLLHFVTFHSVGYTATTMRFEAAISSFGPVADESTPFLRVTSANIACKPIKTALDGMIAIVLRGSCTFAEKVTHVQAAGGAGVVVVNTSPGLFSMGGGDGTDGFQPETFKIPAVMISSEDGTEILKALNSHPQTTVSITSRLPHTGEFPQARILGDDLYLVASGMWGLRQGPPNNRKLADKELFITQKEEIQAFIDMDMSVF